ncbi:DUF1127 domain-containing protein [Pseudomonas sp. PH1b]|uniref:DUF1127 domain-containing protein n=1 Tax=Pseudomonas sp. PH1b TaxID=1397282 RepID=UPI0009DD2FCB|nr:DUF1127 domain-containing protein [Pseudomonas sp. PH1b]
MDTYGKRPTSQTAPGTLRRWMTMFAGMLERTRTRRLLAQMDERQLADCGISHCDRTRELHHPFWR